MFRSLAGQLLTRAATVVPTSSLTPTTAATATTITNRLASTQPGGVAPADMPYLHHGTRPRHANPKFKSPRKRASKLFLEINNDAVIASKERNPAVLGTNFRVGDSIEIEMVEKGGINSTMIEKVRGVVLGRINRGLGSSVYIRDVVFGEPIDRKIPLHSPLLKKITLLETNFVFKGRRKIKRAKLYYLRDRLPQGAFLIDPRAMYILYYIRYVTLRWLCTIYMVAFFSFSNSVWLFHLTPCLPSFSFAIFLVRTLYLHNRNPSDQMVNTVGIL